MAAQKKGAPQLFTGPALKQAVLSLCAKEYERVTYERWVPKDHADPATLRQDFETQTAVARAVQQVSLALAEIRAKRQSLGPWGSKLAAWATAALMELDAVRPDDPPATLLAFILQKLESVKIPREVPMDRRKSAAKQAPPEIIWRGGEHRYRAPTNRELAFMTLLLGHWPDLPLGTPISPEYVVRQEANAISSLNRRRK